MCRCTCRDVCAKFTSCAGGGALEEVIVTANKREQSAQDVGISIAAYSEAQLRALGVQDSTDIGRLTPGVHIGGSIGGQTSLFTIRGVNQNDFTDSVESPVAVYVDEGYIAMAQGQMFGLFDIERVEVAKGPQGTLFGRNATGGLVHYITRKPTRDFSGYVDVSLAEYNNVKVEGAFGGPLGETVAGRLSVLYNKFDPVLDNVIASSQLNPAQGGGEDEWNDESYAVRGQLLFTPSESSEIVFSAFGAHSDVSTGPYQSSPTVAQFDAQGRLVGSVNASPTETREAILVDAAGNDTGLAVPGGIPALDGDFDNTRPVPGGDLFGFVDPDGKGLKVAKDFAYEDFGGFETYGAAVRGTWQLGGVQLASITDYKNFDKLVAIDVDAASYPQAVFYSDAQTDQFSQELRLSGDTSRLKWVTGLYFLSIDNQTKNGLGFPSGSPFTNIIFGGTSLDTVGFIDLETKSYSLFGQVDFALTDRWTLVAGARVVREEKDYVFEQAAFLNTLDRVIDTGVRVATLFPRTAFATSDTLFAGKLQLEFRPNSDALWYIGLNRGAKAGSFNAQLADGSPRLALSDIPYEPEVLTSLEGGFKLTLLDGKARLNGAAYYYDYKDYQAFLFFNASGSVTNKDATIYGGELEFIVNPVERLDVQLGLSAFNATVKDLEFRGGTAAPLLRDVKPSYAPELQASALLRYTWPLVSGGLSMQLDAAYTDEFFHNLQNFESDRFPSYTVANVRLAYRNAADTWELAAFVRNFTDERYQTIGFGQATLCGCDEEGTGKPRWAGVEARYQFGN